jgi:tetrahydromethanopterin S-methyltransferase subunit E
MNFEGILAVIGTFGGIFGIFYLFFTTRNRERIALIENKQTAEVFNRRAMSKKRNLGVAYWTLKFGMLLVGISIGLLVALITNSNVTHTNSEGEGIVYFSSLMLFGGIGLIANFIIEKKAFQEEDQDGKEEKEEKISTI